MKLSNLDLMEEFYKQIKKDYNINFEQLKDICFGPWRFVKQEMESGLLPKIRLKYFGSFQVYEGRAKNKLFNLDKDFRNKKITEEQYKKYHEMLTNYLNRLNEEKSKPS